MPKNLIIKIGNYNDVPLTNVVMTTKSPGGNQEITGSFETRPPYLGLLDLRGNDRVEVFDRQGLIWRGRLEVRHPVLQAGTGLWTLTAFGDVASLRDVPYTAAKTYAGGTAIEAIFKDTRDLLCPDISTSNTLIVATGRTLAGTSADLIEKYAHDVFEAARKIGTSANVPLLWHVWEGAAGAAQESVLELIARPTTPGYVTGLAQGIGADIEWNMNRLFNRIVVKHGDPATYTTVNDTTSQSAKPAGYGRPPSGTFVRAKIETDTAINNATDATNVGTTLLEQYKRERAIANSITVPAGAIIEDAVGSTIPPWRVKAGKILRIRELRAGGIAIPDYDFLLAGTSWSEDAQVLTLTPEGQEDSANIIARLLRREKLV